MRAIGLIFLLFLGAAPAYGQSTDLKIDAGSGIAWMQEQKFYLASGRVRIIRADMTVWSDTARAYYDGDPEVITRIELERNVRFLHGDTEIEGDFAEVFPDTEDVKVTGERPRLQNKDVVISADDFLRYQGNERQVLAEGNALLERDLQKVAAQRMRGVLEAPAAGGALALREAYFWEDVRGDNGNPDSTQRVYVEGDEGYYHLQQAWIRVCKAAKVQRGDNTMRGDCAHYDLETSNFQFLQGGDLTTPLPSIITPPTETIAPTNNRTQLRLKTKG